MFGFQLWALTATHRNAVFSFFSELAYKVRNGLMEFSCIFSLIPSCLSPCPLSYRTSLPQCFPSILISPILLAFIPTFSKVSFKDYILVCVCVCVCWTKRMPSVFLDDFLLYLLRVSLHTQSLPVPAGSASSVHRPCLCFPSTGTTGS